MVAIERHGDAALRIYTRNTDEVESLTVPFQPWFITGESALDILVGAADVIRLDGDGTLSHRYAFDNWSAWQRARLRLRDANAPILTFMSPAEQYLVLNGAALFGDMTFSDLVRMQVDVETTGLEFHVDDARILIITASVNGMNPVILRGDELSEADMLRTLSSLIQEVDPDVIEGHNLFNFDIPYMFERAQRLRVPLPWGRDGSHVRLLGEQRFKAGARTIPFQGAHVYGRHLIDTYQQIQRYDVTGMLESYALKPAVEALGLERSDRTHIQRSDIGSAWSQDRQTLSRYAIDDVLDVNALSELALPTEFYQCAIVPGTLQSVATGGPGEKINDMLCRAYVVAGASIPLPQPTRGYPGGHIELRRTGVFRPVVKCDLESLYPSIMLADRIAPANDHLGLFLPMLESLTNHRIRAKRTSETSRGAEHAYWHGMQSSLKVLVNSFYGYLGYSRGYFNDFEAAEQVTLRGQSIIRGIVERLEDHGALVIEVDTDGVLFQPPASCTDEAAERALIKSIDAHLPDRIHLAHDGRYRGMLSLRLKNYALITHEGKAVLKGSSLRSRREEPFLRSFLTDAVVRLLESDSLVDVRSLYLEIASRLLDGAIEGQDIARTETITDQTFTSSSNQRLAVAAAGERVGERVRVYQRSDGTLARVEHFAGDADVRYLLRRLRETAMRFRPLFDSELEFDYTFPVVSPDTDINALAEMPPTKQLSLF